MDYSICLIAFVGITVKKKKGRYLILPSWLEFLPHSNRCYLYIVLIGF